MISKDHIKLNFTLPKIQNLHFKHFQTKNFPDLPAIQIFLITQKLKVRAVRQRSFPDVTWSVGGADHELFPAWSPTFIFRASPWVFRVLSVFFKGRR
jgi:hypothetical protein